MGCNSFQHGFFCSNDAVLDVGSELKYWNGSNWINAEDTPCFNSGKFSDGIYCYTVEEGIITSKDTCGYTVTVYAKQINNSASITYDINSIPSVDENLVENSECEVKFIITQLQENDEVRFYNSSNFAISGSLSDCPAYAFDCYYDIIIGTSDVNVYLIVDGVNSC